MARPLLETKFYVPRNRGGVVSRPRLSERLNRGLEATLTLVSAPAGFGKTTLLAQWLAAASADERRVAWLSLDQRDDDPVSFWTYVIGALQTVAPAVGVDALSLLQSPRPPPIEAVLSTLLNEIAAERMEIVLVLDDYHMVDARDIQEGMTFLIERLPPRMHVVIASRSDPALPLARLRARGELLEIRAADLRFTPDEAVTYFNAIMRLDLSAQNVSTLEGRTEGWIAALQLAALSIQNRDDVTAFVEGFAGDDRYVVDYLVEEVLQRHPERVRRFLLYTSVLDRLSGPLCDAVTELGGGNSMLEALERGNLFVVPLDDRRRWYRYHHLFADVLHTRLLDEQSEHVPELHRRASVWFEQNGDPSEAIRHALAAADFPRAADLVELAVPGSLRTRQEATLLAWLRSLPRALLRCRPVLSDAYAGALLSTGEVEGIEERLQDAERLLETSATRERPAEMVVVDEDAFRRLPGSIAMHRAGQALRLGDLAATVTYARRTLDLVSEDDHLARGAAAALLGLAAWTGGDLEAGHRAYVEAMARMQRAGHISDALGCAIVLADIRIAQGRLREAMRTYERALQLATEPGDRRLRGTADMHVGLSQLYLERGDLPAATQHLLTSQELGEHMGLPQNPYRVRVATAHMREAHGDLDGALELLEEAERLYTTDFSPDVRPIPALKARVLIRQERLDAALDWARDQGLSAADDLSYVREFEHITLARLLLAQGSIPESLALLERLLRGADDGARTGSVIEVLLLQALAHHAQADTPATLRSLERALVLAEPDGYVRIFVDEGPPMATLLEVAAKHGIAPAYVAQLLEAFGRAEGRTPVKQNLIEPLSERELDVLRLLGTDLAGPDIATELIVSLSTMRTHTRNIYSKLGVSNRRAAVRRAEELELLSLKRKQ